ncbi:hypothetical protein L0F63_001878 [Massospora cicadina]|nr:hypothetical protein L0F63_001878 [Massospora cicadina]
MEAMATVYLAGAATGPVNGLGSGGSTNRLSRTLKANRAIQRNVETLSDSSVASDNVKSKRNPRFGNKGYFSGTGLDAPASGGGSADQPDLDSEFDNNYTSKNYDSGSDGEIDDAVENLQSGDLSSKGSTTGHSSKEEFGSGKYSSENSSTGDSSLDDEDLDEDLPPLGPPPSEVPKELLEPKGGKGLIKGDFVGSLTGEPRTETGYITGLLSAIPILGSVSRNLGVEQFLKTTGV